MNFDLDRAKRILPQTRLCSSHMLPAVRPPRLIAAMAFSPTLESSFSGITFHMTCAGLAARQLEGCFSLYSAEKPLRSLQIRGALWKLARKLQGHKTSGFKFTSDYLDQVWPRYIEGVAGTTLVNNFQLYGGQFLKRYKSLGIAPYFYIDGTLADYFESYDDFDVADIDPWTRQHAIEVEREGYHAAAGITAMSKLTARTLQERYGVPAGKISVVVPGANLLDDAIEALPAPPIGAQTDDFVLGFVGLYPRRKGLDRLAMAVSILRSRGLPIRLRVIGNCPKDLQSMDGLDYLGIIHKRTDLARFIQAISSVDLGCLVSVAELAGIAMVEFLRFGVPILGTNVGGATDILEGGGSVTVTPEISGEELAEVVASLYRDPGRYQKLKAEAEGRRKWASWKRAVAELDAVLP